MGNHGLRSQGRRQQRPGGGRARRHRRPAGAVALGDATNVAARLQPPPSPGTIVVGEETARRLEHRFVLEPLGEIDGEGTRGAGLRLAARRREGPRAARRRRRSSAGTASSGSSGALGDLAAGRGRVVLLVGDAGHGQDAAADRAPRARRGPRRRGSTDTATRTAASPRGPSSKRCSAGSAPRSASRRSRPDEGARRARRAARRRARRRALPPRPRSCDCASSPTEAAGSAERIGRAYVRWLEALARQQPVSSRVEDVHWADAPDARARRSAARAHRPRARRARARPRSRSRLRRSCAFDCTRSASYAHRTDGARARAVVGRRRRRAAEQAWSAAELDAVTRMGLVREAEGNPLYLEELARAFLEGALEPRGRTWTITVGVARAAAADAREPPRRPDRPAAPTVRAGSPRSRRRSAARSRCRARARVGRGRRRGAHRAPARRDRA